MIFRGLLLLVGLGALLGGCVKGDPEVTADQEKTFRNPNKEIPPDIQKKIDAARSGAKPPTNAVPSSGGG